MKTVRCSIEIKFYLEDSVHVPSFVLRRLTYLLFYSFRLNVTSTYFSWTFHFTLLYRDPLRKQGLSLFFSVVTFRVVNNDF